MKRMSSPAPGDCKRERALEEETEISKNSPAHLFLYTSKSETFRCLPRIARFG